jgi:hypothetical protein
MRSSVRPHDEEYGSKKAQRCDSDENVKNWRLESVTWHILD